MYFEKKKMTQAEFLRHFNEQSREEFNPELFQRHNEEIIEQMKDIIMSCERDKYFTLKVLSMRAITNYEEIYETLRNHEEEKNRSKKKKYENNYDYIQIKDSDIMLLEVKYLVRKNGIERMKCDDGIERDVENPEKVLTVLIALPRFVNKYYFRLSGNYYSPIYQIVDGSTYNNATTNSNYDSVIQKTLLMSIRIFRMFKDLVDINTKEKINSIVYTSIIFNNHIPVMYYLLAKYGLYATFYMFHINHIQITDAPTNYDDYYCFKKHNLYVSVPKDMFNGEAIVQSMVVSIIDAINKDTTVANLFSYEFWLMNLGANFKNQSVDKGLFVLDSLESIYDINTKKALHLPEEYKKDIYQLLKWLICEFSPLRTKDNLDISIKRVRLAEYIAHVYAMKLTRGIHRVSDLGKKVRLKQVIAAVYTNPMYILSQIISMSNLVAYADMVNDNDASQVLKCTYKGISGLGEDGASIQPIYRFVDPSHIGILDMDASSASDPGMTGVICPMAKVYHGDSFTDYEEPTSWNNNYLEKLKEFNSKNGLNNAVKFSEEPTMGEFDYIKSMMVKRSLDMDRKICPLKDLDGVMDYSLEVQPKREEVEEKRSLFTIIDEPK